ncbi:ARM repeat-containing protein [Rhizoctonia solani]|uniref:Homoserine kinase n=1 Tax=Rhizoctonia solani TaxID=456999 RepID=A0A8H7IHS6_9AGAM|nr:ARM repeat-containing protein [Rhizoctonia solani]
MATHKFTIKVPATSANIGPGFDVVGLSLSLYLTLTVSHESYPAVSPASPPSAPNITYSGEGADQVPLDAYKNLTTRVALYVLRCNGHSYFPPSLTIHAHNEIPFGRGLGSSGAAVIAGVLLGNALGSLNLPNERLLDFALMVERHPDNVAAALFGAASVPLAEVLPEYPPESGPEWGKNPPSPPLGIGSFVRFNWAPEIKALAIIPQFEVSTAKARNVLRVFNLQRLAVLTTALGQSPPSPELIYEAMKDRVHQPYRKELIPGLPRILSSVTPSSHPGLLGICLSGAGPTILALATGVIRLSPMKQQDFSRKRFVRIVIYTMDPTYIKTLHDLLSQTTANDTNVIKSATSALAKNYWTSPDCIPALFEIINSSPDQSIRQLAAVELRKRVNQHQGQLWVQVPQNIRAAIKSRVTEVILAEPASIVRHNIARVISAIAQYELQGAACVAGTAAHREVGVYVLFTIMDSLMDEITERLATFFNLFGNLIRDPESAEVRVTSVRCLGQIAQYIDSHQKDEIKQFQVLIPNIMDVLADCLERSDEEGARHGFDVFETLLILETPLLSKHMPQLVEFFLRCGGNKSYETSLRIMSLNSLTWTVKYKKSRIQSLNLAKPILEGLMPIGTEEDSEDADDECPSRTAFRVIDELATSLPPSQVFPTLHTIVTQYMASSDPGQRKAALTSFAVTLEGCSEFIRPHMRQLWPLIDAGFADPHPVVRKAALSALGCTCEWLEEEVVDRHATILPVLLDMINNPDTQGAACTALDDFLEILGDTIAQYLPQLMERLSGLLDTAPNDVKGIVTGAIGSAAHAAKSGFLPYFESTMHRLQPFLVLTGEGGEQELRGIAMDTVGTLADAVGREHFRPYFQPVMNNAFEGMSLDSARLRECSYLIFGVMARVFEEEFAPYLDRVVPALIASCKQEEGAKILLLELKKADKSGEAVDLSKLDSESIDIEDVDEEKELAVNSAIAVEKEIAADTIGTVFMYTRSHFLPYVEPCVHELVELLSHYYEGIRKSAVTSLFAVIQTFYELSSPTEWVPGSQVHVPLHQNVKDLIGHVMPEIFVMWETEDDKNVVANVCQSLSETLAKVGPGLAEQHLDTMVRFATEILEGKALCQQDPDQDDEEAEETEDQAEYDQVLISAASDLVAAFASILGLTLLFCSANFSPSSRNIMFSKNRSLSERTSTIGCMGEIISGMKGGVTPFTEDVFNLISQGFSDEDPEVRSNAAFAMGVLIENSDMDISGHYLTILTALRPYFVVAEGAPHAQFNAKDNATGCVARMLLKNSSSMPLDQVIPVFVGALPLKHDFLENRPVFRAIFHLFNNNPDVLAPHIDHLLAVFAFVLDPQSEDMIGDETRAELIRLIKVLAQRVPDKVKAVGLEAYL